jgi:hypothetical protein
MIRLLPCALLVLTLIACGGQSPTATPAFARFTAAGVLASLTAAGIAVADAQPGQRASNEPWPNTHRDWQLFGFAGVPADRRGGQVLTYATPADLAAMTAYLDQLPANLRPYSYTNGNALVFLSAQVPGPEAAKLRDAFMALR